MPAQWPGQQGGGASWISSNFGSKDGTITLGGQQLGIGQATRTYRQLLEVKERCTRAGVFRYGDMYAYAERSLTAHPWIIELLRNRFQVILVDEMQDTAQRQAQLLDTVFPRDRVRVHRFGDSNQSIYGSIEVPDGDGEHFPSPPILHLRESQRFGAFIAGAVSSISANGQGNSGRPRRTRSAPYDPALYGRNRRAGSRCFRTDSGLHGGAWDDGPSPCGRTAKGSAHARQ